MKHKKLCEEMEKLSQQVAAIKKRQDHVDNSFDYLEIRIKETQAIVDGEDFLDQVIGRIKKKQLE